MIGNLWSTILIGKYFYIEQKAKVKANLFFHVVFFSIHQKEDLNLVTVDVKFISISDKSNSNLIMYILYIHTPE